MPAYSAGSIHAAAWFAKPKPAHLDGDGAIRQQYGVAWLQELAQLVVAEAYDCAPAVLLNIPLPAGVGLRTHSNNDHLLA
jgi:hypothetical protein